MPLHFMSSLNYLIIGVGTDTTLFREGEKIPYEEKMHV